MLVHIFMFIHSLFVLIRVALYATCKLNSNVKKQRSRY